MKIKRIISIFLALFFAVLQAEFCFAERLLMPEELEKIEKAANISSELSVDAKSAILLEKTSGKVIYELAADEKMPPASITKIMTLLLVFEAIDEGKLTLETEITASEHACSMGGSQIWLEPGEVFSVHELLKASAISSANDACVALAEAVSGSEETFVSEMNIRAAELGMVNTVFRNATGLDAEDHYSTARDIAIMSAELLKHEMIKDYSTVWMDSLRNGETELTNTNKLVRFYKGCTGLKTGSTDEAGCCLSASAERDGLELISVSLGSPNTDARFASARKLLDYGFANYSAVKIDIPPEAKTEINIIHGTEDSTALEYLLPKSVIIAKGQEGLLKQEIELPEEIEAPINKGDAVGKVKVFLEDDLLCEYNIVSAENAEEMSFLKAVELLFRHAAGTTDK